MVSNVTPIQGAGRPPQVMPYKTTEAKRAYARRRQIRERAKISAYFAEYYAEHRDEILAKNRAWRRRHPGGWRTNHGYRRMVVELLLQRDGACCMVCGEVMSTLSEMTVEHRQPVVAGGDLHRAENLALSHPDCNRRRVRGTWSNHGH